MGVRVYGGGGGGPVSRPSLQFCISIFSFGQFVVFTINIMMSELSIFIALFDLRSEIGIYWSVLELITFYFLCLSLV